MNDRRFFLKYNNGKYYRQVMAIHTIGKVPREVAFYLKLDNPQEYTGHCLRRTSATLLVDSEADVTSLKWHGGWKSSSVAKGYIEESLNNKRDIVMKILQPSMSKPATSVSNEKEIENSNMTFFI